jgi:hypothetical protein
MSLYDDLRAYVQHPAWLDVVEHSRVQLAHLDENLRYRGCSERDADYYRGKAAAYTELLTIHHKLLNPEPDHGD